VVAMDLEPETISRIFGQQLRGLPINQRMETRGGADIWIKKYTLMRV
jgi:hypothetical protein